MLWERLSGRAHVELLPGIGTHAPMTRAEIEEMYPGIPLERFHVHDWRGGVVERGVVPGEVVRDITGGRVDFPIACALNRTLVEGGWDRIIAVGQVVPHEIAGISSHNKSIFVGAGGGDTINKTHFVGAVCDIEKIMGRARTPVRDVFNYMEKHFVADLPISYVLNVRSRDADSGRLVTCGMFAGDDDACFMRAARLSQQVNIEIVDAPLAKVVAWLDAAEFKSTWIGNKAVYRTRMAIADGGALIVLAPGVRMIGEDPTFDRLIRRYGFIGLERTLEAVESDPELAENLGAAAHLVHASTEGRFSITYAPGGLTREEVEGLGYGFADIEAMVERYDPRALKEGLNTLDNGEEVFFVSKPAQGLWSAEPIQCEMRNEKRKMRNAE
jgi:nickel-dependent lactate racemase